MHEHFKNFGLIHREINQNRSNVVDDLASYNSANVNNYFGYRAHIGNREAPKNDEKRWKGRACVRVKN